MHEKKKVDQAVHYLKDKGFYQPTIGIILGTGLNAMVNEFDIETSVSYAEIPHFPISTVEFHTGKLIFGNFMGKKIVAMQGRFHYYEGYSLQEVVFPVRVLKGLGIQKLLISNAAGSMNPKWKKGELMLIEDHINLLPDNPIRGKKSAAFGQIFVDMSQPYHKETNEKLLQTAKLNDLVLHHGVYVAVPGPSLETRAEYRFLRNIGADAVGMSTVPEVIAAQQMELPVAAVSVLTDECDPDNLAPVNIDDIITTAKKAEKNLIHLLKQALKD